MSHRGVVLAIVLFVGGCDEVYGLSRPVDGAAASASRTIVITQGSSETLVDFPVSIVIDNDDLAARAGTDGRDIRFETMEGQALPFELVSYDNGHLEAWVRVTLERRTEIRLRYGDATVVVPDPTTAWSDLFSAVWHLDGDTLEEVDSTHSDNDVATPGANKTPEPGKGRIAGGRKYTDSAIEAEKSALCGTPGHLFVPLSSFALSMWIKPGPAVGRWSMPFEAGGYTTGVGGIAVELDTLQWNTILTGNDGMHDEVPMAQADFDNWSYFTIVVDRTDAFALKLFVNGAQVNETRYNFASIASMTPTCLGGGNGYEGILDEVRIYNGLISTAWIDAEYDNVESRNSFVQVVESGQ